MPIKDLLVQLDQRAASEHCFAAALALAKHHGAHLTALCLVGEPYLPAMVGINLPQSVLDAQRAEAEERADKTLGAARVQAEQAGVPIETRRETGPMDRLADLLARQARHADLVVVGQPDPAASGSAEVMAVEAAFMNTGRPALVIPFIGARTMPPERVVCGWDGSREAARAVHDALPLLATARSVQIIVVDPHRLTGRVGEQPGADIARHLARHGLPVQVETIQSGSIGAADALLSHLAETSADLLVIGGYGHSRLREMVLGGMTEHMLRHMTVPVLFAH